MKDYDKILHTLRESNQEHNEYSMNDKLIICLYYGLEEVHLEFDAEKNLIEIWYKVLTS